MTKWRYFGELEFPRAIRELGLPAATSLRDTVDRCPMHDKPLGSVSSICAVCFRTAWDEVARRYREQGRPTHDTNTDAKEVTMTSTELAERGPEIIDAEIAPPAPLTLFGTSNPRIALQRMAEIATALIDVIDTKRLYVTINGRKHITVEGWTTLGGMTGVVPIVTSTRANESGDGIVAHVEARRVGDGMVVGAAEGECSRAESKWKNRDPFALRSMAQTRAISRALRAPLGQIVVLAGYDPSAAEEMPAALEAESRPAARESVRPIAPENLPTVEQAHRLKALLLHLTQIAPDTDWAAKAREIAGTPYELLTTTTINGVIETLEAELAARSAA